MRERIRFLLLYYLFWVVFFVCARILFLAYHVDTAKLLTLETVYGIFSHGIIMDLSMAAYYSLLPFLWVTFSNFIYKGVFQNTIFSYTFILVTLSNLIIVSDLEVYNIWNYRLDETPLKFLKSPKEAFISVRSSPIFRLLISYLFLVAVASIIVYRIVANKIYDWKKIKPFPFVVYGLIMTLLLIIPIRGGLSKETLRPKHVYFSENAFANISALNAPWNFAYSLIKKVSANLNPYTYFPKENIDSNLDQLYRKNDSVTKVVQSPMKETNVLIIMVENFSSKVIDKQYQGRIITPHFNKLKNEGIYFDNFYSAADRSDKTVLSVLSGYPAQPRETILDYPEKVEKLPILSRDFYNQGYSTQFYYGGDASFLSLKNYLFNGNFEKIIDKDDYEDSLNVVSIGVSDEQVYRKFIEEHRQIKNKPFFSTILTASSHEPFGVPGEKLFGDQNLNEHYYNALHYADKSLNDFLEEAKKQVWWPNTLIVIVGNRGNKMPESGSKIDNFKVPMLWTGGAIHERSYLSNVYSQTDIAASILAQVGLSAKEYIWSKNIFGNKTKPWAFFTFNDGFGFVSDRKSLLFDNVGRIVTTPDKVGIEKELNYGKALLQKSYQHYLDL